MATFNVVHNTDVNELFGLDISNGDLRTKIDGTLTFTPAGELSVVGMNVTIVSADTGNLLVASATDDGAFFDQAALQAAETVWNGTGNGFITVTNGGTNGHAPAFAVDFTDPAFIEAAQDAVGTAIANGAGINYDDALNAISSAVVASTAGDGLQKIGDVISILPDPASPDLVTVSAAGLSVQALPSADAGNLLTTGADGRLFIDAAAITALATEEICDLAGNVTHRAFA